MEKIVRFFKEGGKWYADIPNHTLDENEMVMGADTALEAISNGKDEVTATLSDTYPGWNTPLALHIKEHDDEGAYYTVSGVLLANILNNTPSKPEIWVCNVTHDVFGEHPEHIYVLKVEWYCLLSIKAIIAVS